MNKYKTYNSCIISVAGYVVDICRHIFVHCIIYIIMTTKIKHILNYVETSGLEE